MRFGQVESGRRRRLGAGLLIGGLVMGIAGFAVAGAAGGFGVAPSTWLLVTIFMAVALAGIVMVALGVAALWFAGRTPGWARAVIGGFIGVAALVTIYAIFPAWWLWMMSGIGIGWLKDLVVLVVVGLLLGVGWWVVQESPAGYGEARVTGVSAYGRPLIKR